METVGKEVSAVLKVKAMNIDATVAVIGAVVAILGSLITGIATYITTRSGVRNETERIRLEKSRLGIETTRSGSDVATQLTDISLRQLTLIQESYVQSMTVRRTLEEENSTLRLAIENLRVNRQAVLVKLKLVIKDHEKRLKLSEPLCPYFESIQEMLMELQILLEQQ